MLLLSFHNIIGRFNVAILTVYGTKNIFTLISPEACSEPSQTSRMEHFAEIVNDFSLSVPRFNKVAGLRLEALIKKRPRNSKSAIFTKRSIRCLSGF